MRVCRGLAPGQGLWAALTLLVVAFNLRGAFTALGPVLPEVMRDLKLPAGGAGALTTVPVICIGLAAPVAPVLARRFGAERALLLLMLMVAVGCGLRGFAGFWPLAVGGAVLGTGIGMANVLLPGLVKRDFAERTGLMTGLYSMALAVSAAAGSGASVPLARLAGGWSSGLVLWALPALAAAALLLVRASVPQAQDLAAHPASKPRLWCDPLAWQVTLLMGTQSTFTYILFAWLPPLLRDHGVDAVAAGLISAASTLTQMGGALVAPILAGRPKFQRWAAPLALSVAFAGYLLAVHATGPWILVGTTVMGLAQGSIFSVSLMLMVLRSPDPRMAAQLSSMAQGVGYLMAAAGPIVVGLLHDALGGWQALTPSLAILAVAGGAAGLGAGRPLFIGRVRA